jgi:predicted phosphodiesterase
LQRTEQSHPNLIGKVFLTALIAVSFAFSVAVLYLRQSAPAAAAEPAAAEDITASFVINAGSEWDYLDNGEAPGEGNAWTQLQYDSSGWKHASGPFSVNAENGTTRLLSGSEGGSPTVFFRREFQVEDLSDIRALVGKIIYSDSVILYLNGNIVYAGNVPDGGYKSNQELGVAQERSGVSEEPFTVSDLAPLRRGTNVLAVEIHRGSWQSGDLAFYISNMAFSESLPEEDAPEISGVMLEQGRTEKEVIVNWMTAEQGSYAVELMEASKYDAGSKMAFSQNATKVLMGEKSGSTANVYKATLSYLKTSTKYAYCIAPVGSKEHSEVLYFSTPGNTDYSFAVLGDPQLGSYGKDDSALWNSCMSRGFALTGMTDDILVVGDLADNTADSAETQSSFLNFRRPGIFRQIPSAVIRGNHDEDSVNADLFRLQYQEGDYSYTCQNILFLALDSNIDDIAYHRDFISDTIAASDKKWRIVLMHHSLFSSGEHTDQLSSMRSEMSAVFSDADIDLVISGHDHIYSRSYLMQGENIITYPSHYAQKKTGETLYICAGSSSGNKFYDGSVTVRPYTAKLFTNYAATIIKGVISEDTINIYCYRTEQGTLVDSFSLKKGN